MSGITIVRRRRQTIAVRALGRLDAFGVSREPWCIEQEVVLQVRWLEGMTLSIVN